MRYYSKIGWTFWISLINGLLGLLILIRGHGPLDLTLSAVLLFGALVQLLSQLFCFVELRPDGLEQRRFWNVRIIPYDQISHIAPDRLNGRRAPGWLTIDFLRPAPMCERGTLLLTPSPCTQFIAALRQAAPQAAVEDLASSTASLEPS